MLSFIASLVASAIGQAFKALFGYVEIEKQRKDTAAAHERAAVAEGADETQQTIAETADERSKIPDDPDDADALARSLRTRRHAGTSGGNHSASSRSAGS